MENRYEQQEQTRTKKPNIRPCVSERESVQSCTVRKKREEEKKDEQVRKVSRKKGIKVILSCKYSEFLFCLNFFFFFFKYMIHI